MADFPVVRQTILPAGVIHAGGLTSSLGDMMKLNASAWASATVTQNRACYLAFQIESPVTVYRIGWENGATSNGNLDVGIYNEAGTRLVSSGSTAQGTVSVFQVVDVTDTLLVPGSYFMAIASDSATATLQREQFGSELGRTLGCQWEASAFPLPATATMSAIASAVVYNMSLMLRAEM